MQLICMIFKFNSSFSARNDLGYHVQHLLWNFEQIMWIFIQKSFWSIHLQKSFWPMSSSNIVIESFESRSCLLNKRRRHQIITHNPGILFLRTHVAGGFFLLTMPNAIVTLLKSYIQCNVLQICWSIGPQSISPKHLFWKKRKKCEQNWGEYSWNLWFSTIYLCDICWVVMML